MMMLVALLAPLLLGLLALCGRRIANRALRLAPLAALPAIWLALTPGDIREFEYLLIGITLAVDSVSRPFLLIVGVVWAVAGWYAADRINRHRQSFSFFWLLTLFGIQLACLAADIVTFYLGYAVMSLAAWGLIMHDRDSAALRAGQIYLVMMLLSEALILAGILQLAALAGNAILAGLGGIAAESPPNGSVFWLFLCGFGIKLGIVPVHFWAALADPAAPAPARAVLSGTLVKAGLLGWLRFLPPEMVPIGLEPVTPLLILGLVGAFGGALFALTQTVPRVILAYSTISQMGLLLMAFALTLAGNDVRVAMIPVISLFVIHHGLNKAALFLGTGCEPGSTRLRMILLVLPGLALAGAPLMSGDLFKSLLKPELPDWTSTLLTWTSVTTMLLILHLLWRSGREADHTTKPTPMHPAWPVLVILALTTPWLWISIMGLELTLTGARLWESGWPLLLAAGLFALWQKAAGGRAPACPAGDIVIFLEFLWRQIRSTMQRLPASGPDAESTRTTGPIAPIIGLMERRLRSMPVLGAVLMLISVALWALLLH